MGEVSFLHSKTIINWTQGIESLAILDQLEDLNIIVVDEMHSEGAFVFTSKNKLREQEGGVCVMKGGSDIENSAIF